MRREPGRPRRLSTPIRDKPVSVAARGTLPARRFRAPEGSLAARPFGGPAVLVCLLGMVTRSLRSPIGIQGV